MERSWILYHCVWLFTTAFLLYSILNVAYIYIILLVIAYVVYERIVLHEPRRLDIKGKSVLITGCDTGIGNATVMRLEQFGLTVFAGCLVPESEGARALRQTGGARMHVIHLDVTNDEHATKAVKYVKQKCSAGLWALINNAAINRLVDVELASMDVIQQVTGVNLFGMIRVTKAFLPMLRSTKGRVINVTSVRRRVALATDVAYTISKWASEAFSDILRREMYMFGVKVVIIEPGNFGGLTGMLNKDNLQRIEDNLNASWDAADTDVRRAYGRRYVDALLGGMRECGSTSCRTLEPLMVAMENAVTCVNPRYRYLVHGGNKLMDWYCFIENILKEKTE